MTRGADSSPLVSVVIPAFNNESTIAEAIESVLAQRGVSFQLLISDHASSDRTLQVAESFLGHPRVSVVTAPVGGGAAANWNHVTERATGSLLKLVCGDDTLLPGVLARQAELLDDPAVSLVACRRHVIDARGRVRIRDRGLQGLRSRMAGPDAIRAAVRSGTNPFGEPACVMFRRETLNEVGGWWGERPYVIDLATYFRVLEYGDFVADDSTGATFRISANQQSARMIRTAAREVGWLARWACQRHAPVIGTIDRCVGTVRRIGLAAARGAVFSLMRLRSKEAAT